MLNDLVVVNGIMSPNFNPNVFEYEVFVDNNTISLVLEYSSQNKVTIYGNELLIEGENHVLLEVYDDKLYTYTLKVYKENTITTFNEEKIVVDTSNYLSNNMLITIISITCLITIILLFYVLFKSKVVKEK